VSSFLEDRASFGGFYREHARALLIFFTRRTFDAQTALELTAETFAAAFASRRTFHGRDPSDADAWLFTIARRKLVYFFEVGAASGIVSHQLGIEVPAATGAELEQIECASELDVIRAALREQLTALSPGERDVVWLRVVDEQPYARVAERLGISETAARARVSRALRLLGEALTPDVPEVPDVLQGQLG
jgi:RNA polymerase sigma-70 factor, ECF subfamily